MPYVAKQDIVNRSDPALKRWLDIITKPGTKYGYKTAFRAYMLFLRQTGSGKTVSELIDEALVDAKRDQREKRTSF